MAPEVHSFIQRHRVARMATVDSVASPHLVPICYAYDGQNIYSVLDRKPKQVSPKNLKRVRNLLSNPRVGVVVDDYSEEWSRLAYVIAQGSAQLLEDGEEHKRAVRLLKEKYPQYVEMGIEESPVIKITIEKLISWGNLT
ncbi:MAG: TIGR03668 family PPOX class F420-dependent oxidoreductase [Chloroflexi bacterium]|nr:TIGR03668 family PPOX class F420-dependent oxidoreductase [Chloroflexota bacterium]